MEMITLKIVRFLETISVIIVTVSVGRQNEAIRLNDVITQDVEQT
jgi:hypothetical protein